MFELHSIILNKPSLAWYVEDPSALSDESVVEHVLQYGDWSDVQMLFNFRSKKDIANLFYQSINKQRSNYSPQIKHFFTLYFQHNA